MAKLLQVGMEVVIHPRGRSDLYEFSTVTAISPSGRIVTIADGRKYNGNNGHAYGASSQWTYEWIEPLTNELRQRIAKEQERLVEKKRRDNLTVQIVNAARDLTADQLQQVADLIATFPKPE